MPEFTNIVPLDLLATEAGPARSSTSAFLRQTEFRNAAYYPPRQQDWDADIAVAIAPFQWNDEAPKLWLLATCGLEQIPQPVSAMRECCPPSFELVTAFKDPRDNTFDAVRRYLEDGVPATLRIPAVVHQFLCIAQDIASWMIKDREAFGLGDPIKNASLHPSLPSSILGTPLPELVYSGIQPYRKTNRGVEGVGLDIGDWLEVEAVIGGSDCSFLHLAPVTSEEFNLAQEHGGFSYFMNALVPTDEELDSGLDSSSFIADPNRSSRADVFRSSLASE